MRKPSAPSSSCATRARPRSSLRNSSRRERSPYQAARKKAAFFVRFLALLASGIRSGADDASLQIDPEHDIDLLTIVELAHRLGIALVPLVLGVNLVIHVGGELGELIGAVRADDVAGDRVSTGIGKVDDRVDDRVVLFIENLTGEHAPGRGLVPGVGRNGSR